MLKAGVRFSHAHMGGVSLRLPLPDSTLLQYVGAWGVSPHGRHGVHAYVLALQQHVG